MGGTEANLTGQPSPALTLVSFHHLFNQSWNPLGELGRRGHQSLLSFMLVMPGWPRSQPVLASGLPHQDMWRKGWLAAPRPAESTTWGVKRDPLYPTAIPKMPRTA